MDDDRSGEAAVAAGAVAGIAGPGVFLVAHQLWIVPIWFIAPVGAIMAGFGGAIVGASYATLRPHLPRRPWTVPAVDALCASMLAPAVLIGELRGPIFAADADGGGTLLVPPAEALGGMSSSASWRRVRWWGPSPGASSGDVAARWAARRRRRSPWQSVRATGRTSSQYAV